MDKIVYTGDNVAEIEAFATQHGFGFSVGSNIRCPGCRHTCVEEPDVLEIFGTEWLRDADEPSDKETHELPTWTHADPGDIIYENASVTHNGPPIEPY